RAEDERDVERQAQRVALNLHVAFLHDVEQTNLNLTGEIREFVDGKDAAVGAGQQAVMHRELAGEVVSAAGCFDGIDIADQIGNRYVRRGELFNVALFGREPCNRRVVALFGNERAAAFADGIVRIVMNFTTGDEWHLRIEQAGQRPQDTTFGLSAQSKKD